MLIFFLYFANRKRRSAWLEMRQNPIALRKLCYRINHQLVCWIEHLSTLLQFSCSIINIVFGANSSFTLIISEYIPLEVDIFLLVLAICQPLGRYIYSENLLVECRKDSETLERSFFNC